jgi:hypothetical protein
MLHPQVKPMFLLPRDNAELRCIEFKAIIASDIITLADDLNYWYRICEYEGGNDDSEDDRIVENDVPIQTQ